MDVDFRKQRSEIMVSSYKKCYDILSCDTDGFSDVVIILSEA